MKDEKKHPETKHIFVNKKKFDVTADTLTGEQILALAGFSKDTHDLYLVHGHEQTPILPDKVVEIKNGIHFHAVPKVIPFGSK